MKRFVLILLLSVFPSTFVDAEESAPPSDSPPAAAETRIERGQANVEVTPTQAACCATAKDRATVAAQTACFPGRVVATAHGDCRDTPNALLPEYVDCSLTWEATCSAAPPTTENGPDPCAGIDCSDNGSCTKVGDAAICVCKEGFLPDPQTGRRCIPLTVFQNQVL